ncbi:hypothetical protein [Variovorax paradoxus]|jgi:hypothetical protein|uniref:hypothetical protein n=1 Tax=Variovorax paradoxus TaxID=34073 RepID=UPI001185EB3F|nr:hypothetical protein [Variovorax paradoxus]
MQARLLSACDRSCVTSGSNACLAKGKSKRPFITHHPSHDAYLVEYFTDDATLAQWKTRDLIQFTRT